MQRVKEIVEKLLWEKNIIYNTPGRRNEPTSGDLGGRGEGGRGLVHGNAVWLMHSIPQTTFCNASLYTTLRQGDLFPFSYSIPR